MIGSMKSQPQSSTSGKKNATASSPPAPTADGNTKQNPVPEKTSEVNAIQSSQQSGGKKKANNGKNKKADSQEPTKTQEPATEPKEKRKAKYPCMICSDDHYTKDCPHKEEVAKFLKANAQPVVLKNPFPTQQ